MPTVTPAAQRQGKVQDPARALPTAGLCTCLFQKAATKAQDSGMLQKLCSASSWRTGTSGCPFSHRGLSSCMSAARSRSTRSQPCAAGSLHHPSVSSCSVSLLKSNPYHQRTENSRGQTPSRSRSRELIAASVTRQV